MGTLKVSYSELRKTGDNIVKLSDEFGTLLNSINSTNENLKSSWAGSDASRYSDAVALQAKNAAKLNETMDEVGKYLVKAAATYEAVNNDNYKRINI